MPRTIKNILTEADLLESHAARFGDPQAAMARYGADLLGRAIGHEMRRDRALGLPETLFYSNLIHGTGHTATRKVMAFTAAREIQAL